MFFVVYGFPRFPWSEKEYLRTQIARIAASTLIAPRGTYAVGDDDAVALDEEYRGSAVEDLAAADGWCVLFVHLPYVLSRRRFFAYFAWRTILLLVNMLNACILLPLSGFSSTSLTVTNRCAL